MSNEELREKFETWCCQWGGDRSVITFRVDGEYFISPVQSAWEAFQAGAAQADVSTGEAACQLVDDAVLALYRAGDISLAPGAGIYQRSAAPTCQGIPRPGCDYLASCGTVCNKCGREHAVRFLSEQPAAPAVPADCPRGELVMALHILSSHYENSLGAFGDDTEARRKAEADIAHAVKVAAKYNYNGVGCRAVPAVPAGYKLIRREPTQSMRDAALNAPAFGHPETAIPSFSAQFAAAWDAAPEIKP